MARVTVEDCLKRDSSRSKLVVVAAERTKNISSGAPLTVERDNDKDPVIALREIENKNIDTDKIWQSLVIRLQKHNKIDTIEGDKNPLPQSDIYTAEDIDHISSKDSESI